MKSLINPISLLSTDFYLQFDVISIHILYFYDVCMYPQVMYTTILHYTNIIILYMSIFNLLFHVDKCISYLCNCYTAFPLYEYSELIHSPADRHLHSFQCLAIMKTTEHSYAYLLLNPQRLK